MRNYDIQIGDLILEKLKEEKRTVRWLAKEMNTDPSNLRKRLNKNSMDTERLRLISKALNYNFFQFYIEEN